MDDEDNAAGRRLNPVQTGSPVAGRSKWLGELVRACRLTIYLGHADQHRHHALAAEVVRRAQRAGLAGATVLEGMAGYGHSGRLHTQPMWQVVQRTPVTVHIVDRRERIDAFLPQLDDLAGSCLIVRDEVDVPGDHRGS